MDNTTRTVYAALLQTNLFLDLPHNYATHSTLNEALGINSNILPNTSEKNSLKFWTIGIRGHQGDIGTNGLLLVKPIPHRATDGNNYYTLPFVLREVGNDLTPTERAKYALRKEEVISGVTYIAYYARRIDFTGVTSGMKLITVDSQSETVSDFVPGVSNLNPTPPTLPNTGTTIVSGEYVAATARISIGMTPQEAQEFRNVCDILFQTTDYALVSEIALCTGVNRSIQYTNGPTTISMNEGIGVQVATFIPSMNHLNSSSNNGFELELDVGVREPMYTFQTVGVTP